MSEQFLICEVAVVGGGPAGSICAAALASRGLDVVLLERYHMPRRKVCAGGLSVAALKLLPCEVSTVVECEFDTLRVTSLGGRRVEWTAASPFMVTAYREELDWLLWQRASLAGVRTLDGCRVTAVRRSAEGVVVSGDGFSVSARYVVGADGANGIVRRLCQLGRPRHVATGMMVEVPRPALEAGGQHTPVQLVGGLGDSTFGWVFPRRETLSIGVEWHSTRTDIDTALARVVALPGADVPSGTPRYSHPIPSIPASGRVVADRVLLVGDAAGMCDPLTGEGVRNAVHSGQVAADVLADACRGTEPRLADYQEWFDREILPELKAGMTMLHFALRFENAGLLALQHQERSRRACVAVLRGETTYRAILRGAEPLGGLATVLLGKGL